ncbi:MAG TPA: SPFH domain-containing protein [Myxococcales bacterium]|jgi:regulator of protease activity HflC (stomatin/prohibitin superfamily)
MEEEAKVGRLKAALLAVQRVGERLGGLRQSARARRLALGIGAALLAAAFLGSSLVRVREGEVGVLVNNLTGSVGVEEQQGYRLVVPWAFSFFRLDRRVRSVSMTEQGGGGFDAGDAVKIKTADGSNVSIDLQASYRLIPGSAAQVLRDAGPGVAFGDLWMRSAVRAMSAREFGKLTTEQVYDATLRNERAQSALIALNEELAPRGIEVVALVPQDFRFYKDYEEIIKKKKLADQEVEEQQAQARLAVEEQNKQVGAAKHAATAKTKTAEGEADRVRAEADGYVQRVRLDAESTLLTATKKAEGALAIGLAEAQGMAEAARAVNGQGGVNLVAVEYAKQLGKISFTGVPVMADERQAQLRLQSPIAGAK